MHTPSEFEFLTQETVRISEEMRLANMADLNIESYDDELYNEFSLSSHFDEPIVESEDQRIEYPNKPGLVYTIFKSGTTFSLRGFACESIEEAFDSIYSGEKSFLRALRLNDSELDQIKFFELSSFERAEIVLDQVFNKRFPLEEDVLCNISDPGFSWWYGKADDGFRINFKSHKFMCQGERTKLGPIGDVIVACLRFAKLKEHFKYHLPISELVINEKQFVLRSSDKTHPIMKELMNLFERGEISEESALLCELDLSLRLYLLELADIRRFWIDVEGALYDNNLNLLN
ncbi:hypothetical protein [Bacteriovorax sp. Seq25_V]|uniref:hypothetical protein n=1 Tax=Bacteriovorax sp. Seq25_V TaxID=1201288 RepID=UPI00038A199B|nr:hypothetical protein [Bacteriovorax sp. Seq25_V]EQC45389.1 hypothetical protein M900_2053 [Bacteriovorax sp. Seq25_V]